ncbi:PadR family transcriptional regulator [Streptomyces adustus]|uniref:PadR family transcriptional regulator n=1 Tax=Streptomyces adustus TaxID=1609272 RepID=UPI0035D94631
MELGSGKAEGQLRKGVLEYCVLSLLRSGPRYGIELIEELAATGVLATSQGTIYPLLSRLRRDELVSTSWRESLSGPPRRYYELTDSGAASLREFTRSWVRFKTAVDRVVLPSDQDTDPTQEAS